MQRGVMLSACIIILLLGCTSDDQQPTNTVVAKTGNNNPLMSLTDDVVDTNTLVQKLQTRNEAPTKSQPNDTVSVETLLALHEQAIQGSPKDQLRYASALLSKGTPYHDKFAFYWTQKAAVNNDPEASFMLGYLYYAGIGTPVNYAKSRALFYPLASADVPQAQYYMAKIYFEGLGVERDIIKAKKWISHAVEGQLPEAKSLAQKIFSAPTEEEEDEVIQDMNMTDKKANDVNTLDTALERINKPNASGDSSDSTHSDANTNTEINNDEEPPSDDRT